MNGTILFPLEEEATRYVIHYFLAQIDHIVFFSFDFTMCNPPFYSSADEIENLAKEKATSPNAVSPSLSLHLGYT